MYFDINIGYRIIVKLFCKLFLSDLMMDFNDSCRFLENNIDQFHLVNLLSPNSSDINLNSSAEQDCDQVYIIFFNNINF